MLAVAGPTACNKSRIAERIAERFGGEIISVDSGAVYRGMDIGTAKPDAAARKKTRHHIIDVCAPDEPFNVGRFCELAHAAAADIQSRNKLPIFVGGTMMYYRTLTAGLYAEPPVPPAVRRSIREAVQQYGAAAMHAALARQDAAQAAMLPPGDTHRIIRALELLAAGSSQSALKQGAPALQAMALPFILFVPPDRARLRQSIGERLDGMFAEGLLCETRTVIKEFKLDANAQSLRLAGYRQAAAHLNGEYDETEMRRRAYHATCQLAKRQLTWLRSWPKPLATVDPFAPNAEAQVLQAAEAAVSA